MKIPYYPGCTLKTTARNMEISAIESAKILGIEMIELPRWNCCGVVASLTSDDLISHLAPVRNLMRVEEMNEEGLVENEYRMLTLCSMCFNTLRRSNLRMAENPEDLISINDVMYLEKGYDGKTEVIHFFELLDSIGFDKIEEKVKKPLTGLKIAPYYGCMLLRPKEVGIDSPEDPTIIQRFISSIGAEPVPWEAKTICCGSYHTVSNKDIVIKLAYEIITNARKHGAEAIITSCPLCAFNLDDRQKEVREKYLNFEPMPVLYFSQLLALALGLEGETLGLEQNYIDPKPLLKEKGHL